MRTRIPPILAIICLQGYSTTVLSQENGAGTVDMNVAGECRGISSPRASNLKDKKLCKWTDESGNVYYSDTAPGKSAERLNRILQDQGACPEHQFVAKRLQELADIAWQTYLESPELSMSPDERRALLFAPQSRRTDLNIRILERWLAVLESAEYIPECEELLRQEIRAVQEEIERQRRDRDHYRDDLERIQDPPGRKDNGDERGGVGRTA